MREYIDFKLYITKTPDKQNACRVALLPTPKVGETPLPADIPAEESPPEHLLALLAAKQITLRDSITLGKKLANCLLPNDPEIRERFKFAYDRAGPDGGVRLRLIIADHSLKQWPWEYVFLKLMDGPDSMAGFLALNPRISIVRHEPLLRPHPVPKKASGDVTNIRLAIAAALPEKQHKLDLGKEVENIKLAVEDFDLEGVRITVDPVWMDTTPQLLSKLPSETFIFHFVGHGTTETKIDRAQRGGRLKEEGALLLVEGGGSKKERRMRAVDLAKALQGANVRLAVLGACHSGKRDARYPWDGVAGALAAGEIPAIVAMQYEVIDEQAISFSDAFYSALASGLSLDEAMSFGRHAMLLETSTDPAPEQKVDVEWGVPVLYSRLRDGKLFPERMERAGEAAEQFRKVIRNQIDRVAKDGKVVVVKAKRVGSSLLIETSAGVVEGEYTTLEVEEL